MPALVAGIHVLFAAPKEDLDGRTKSGHDGPIHPLLPVRWIAGILVLRGEEPQHRRPFQHAIGPPRARLIKMRGVGQHVLARHGQFGARRHGVDLRSAGHFELIYCARIN